MDDPDWQRGVRWGRPRRGHPEGTVLAHIHEVLDNVDRLADSPEQRARLAADRAGARQLQVGGRPQPPEDGPEPITERSRAGSQSATSRTAASCSWSSITMLPTRSGSTRAAPATGTRPSATPRALAEALDGDLDLFLFASIAPTTTPATRPTRTCAGASGSSRRDLDVDLDRVHERQAALAILAPSLPARAAV